MKVFKVTFVNNEPVTITDVSEKTILEGSHHCVHTNGKIIYALVKSETELDVLEKVGLMVAEVKALYSMKNTAEPDTIV